MIRFGTRFLANPSRNPWRGALAGAAVLAGLGFATLQPALADDVPRASRPNYVQYEHDAVVHSQQLMASRATDAEAANDRALAAEQDRERQAASQDQNGAQQAHNSATPIATTNQ